MFIQLTGSQSIFGVRSNLIVLSYTIFLTSLRIYMSLTSMNNLSSINITHQLEN